MTDKIQRSVYYYELLAKKHTTSGFGENQARVYQELAELVAGCSTIEEIQQRMRDQGYLEKPAQALYLDKMAAHKRAADTNAFPGIAEIYQKKYDEVQTSYQAAFTTGWEQDVGRELNRIGNIVGAFNEIFAAYLRYNGTHPSDNEHQKSIATIRNNVDVIQNNGSTFDAAVDLPYYRRHSPLNDAQYARARDGIRAILLERTEPDLATSAKEITRRTEDALQTIEAKQDELKKLGEEFNERCRRSVWLSIAPATDSGPYTRELFYEGRL